MKVIKRNLKVIIAFIIGMIITCGITVYANNILASNVTYKNNKNVETALNELYSNISNNTQDIFKSGSFTSVNGDNTINIGFTPKKLLVGRTDTPTLINYDSEYYGTEYYLYQAGPTKNTFKAQVGTGIYWWQLTEDDNFSISDRDESLNTYLKSVSNNSAVINTNAVGKKFYWIAFM